MTSAHARTAAGETPHDRLVAARRAIGPWVGLSALPALLAALGYTLGRVPGSWVVTTMSVWLVFAVAFALLDVLAGRTQPQQQSASRSR